MGTLYLAVSQHVSCPGLLENCNCIWGGGILHERLMSGELGFVCIIIRCNGVRRHSTYSFLTSELEGVSGQRHALAALYHH
jgi:hypothetical protein